MKKTIKWLLLAYVAATCVVIVGQEFRCHETGSKSLWAPGDYLAVTYFHSNKRCSTCRNMEAYTKEALHKYFKDLLVSGKLRIRVLNWQDPSSAPFVKKYSLMGNALIVSVIRDGRESRYKNLEDIWTLVSNHDGFVEYVHREVKNMVGAD